MDKNDEAVGRKGAKIIFIIIALIFLAILLKKIYEYSAAKHHGVYVIGKLYKRTEGGKNSGSLFYYYNYNGKKYTHHFGLGIGYQDSLIFIKVWPKNPKASTHWNYEYRVPYCLTLNDVPDTGWVVLPLDACD